VPRGERTTCRQSVSADALLKEGNKKAPTRENERGQEAEFGGVLAEKFRGPEGVDVAQAVEGKADCCAAAAYEPACAEEEIADAAVEEAAESESADRAKDVADPAVGVHRSKQRACTAERGR
jgi:hypothetical protein